MSSDPRSEPRAEPSREDGATQPVERRAAERRVAARRSSQTVLRQMVDRLPDGIVVVDRDGRVRFANPAAERLFGRPASELVGQEFGYALTTQEAAEIEIVRRGAGVAVAELRIVDSVWDDEPATLVALRDVTDRKRAEEHERQLDRERAARAEAEAANQTKSEFLAVMSHELRTPLNAVIGYAELLDLGVVGRLSAEQRRQVGRITASGRHLLGLVNEILDFAKVEAGQLTVARVPTGLAEVVEAAETLALPQAEGRGLTLHAPHDVDRALQFIGDRDRVLQILANLLSNAVKFTEPGGTIHVRVSTTQETTSPHLPNEQRWIAVQVADTGAGIAPEQLDDVFSPFVQGTGGHTRPQDGAGLGLTISRRLARLMRGDVTVTSTVGQGSEFTLWLPAAEATAAEPAAAVGSAKPLTRGLADCGAALLHESEAILDAYVAQLRREATIPAARSLRSSQLVDHAGALLADVAAALVGLDEAEGTPTGLLRDTADIQRFIADRHGLQRARLGWTPEALARESAILQDEVTRALRRRCTGHDLLDEALGVVGRYLEQAAETAAGSLARALPADAARATR